MFGRMKTENKKEPKVSVLLPVYNTKEAYLRECIESILQQSYRDFELIIINDASTDAHVETVINSYDDARIRYYKNENNLGISETRNKLVDLSRGEYLAIMDHDDVSLTDRFKKQVAYLDEHPEIGVLGTAHREIPKNKTVIPPEDNEGIEEAMMLGCALLHPTTMIRKSVLEDTGLRYDKEYFPTEDYNLYLHLLGKTHFGCLPEVLFLYRKHESNTTKKETRQIRSIEERVFGYLQSEHRSLWDKVQFKYPRLVKVKIFGIPVLKIKRFRATTKYYLFGILPIAEIYSKVSAKLKL